MAESVLRVRDLGFGYRKSAPIFRDFSLDVGLGEIVSVVGPSGVGKSTLFELAAGALTPQKGSIEAAPLAQVFQDPYESFHHSYTVLNQIADVADIAEAEPLALRLGLDPVFLKKHPYELSGGQLQRCSILRALLMKPRLLQ